MITDNDIRKALPHVVRKYINWHTDDVRKKGFKYDVSELSRNIGVARASLYYLLEGTTVPKLTLILNLIKELKIDPSVFVDELMREIKRV